MKNMAISFGIAVLVFAIFVVWKVATGPAYDLIALGNFVVVSLTLIALVWYAYDTNAIARITRDRWKREGVLGTTYGIQLVGVKGDAGRTLVQLSNSSPLVVHARLNCNFRLYGHPVDWGRLYNGEEEWVLFPQQLSQGWFEIESLVQKRGRTVASLISESTDANRVEQLTMKLEMEFRDEFGERRKLPPREHYFDFERWAWIPQLGHRE